MKNKVDLRAAQWATRLDLRAPTAEEAEQLRRWLDASPLHRGALIRAQAVLAFAAGHAATASQVQLSSQPSADHVQRPDTRFWNRRRMILAAAVSALAASAVGVVSLGTTPRDRAQQFATRTGEVHSVRLSDGSAVTLDARSRVAFMRSGSRRMFDLIAGRALIDVAHDPKAPFVVGIGPVAVRAVGTSFSVERHGDDEITITTREGVVAVRDVRRPGFATRLGADDSLHITPRNTTLIKGDPDSTRARLQWRAGILAFAGTSLADAAATFARYSDVRIRVDPRVASEQVTGRFSSRDPQGFATAAASSLGLHAALQGNEIVIRPN